jgi:hypothetical protein
LVPIAAARRSGDRTRTQARLVGSGKGSYKVFMRRSMFAVALLVGVGCAYMAAASAGSRFLGSDVAHAATTTRVVLGSRNSFGPYGRGWGARHPALLDNDGDPSGHAWNIHWTSWGTTVARGSGRIYFLGPERGSGYRTGRLQLRATRIGRCSGDGPSAYTRLEVRVAELKHGAFSRWQLWNGRPNLCHATR